jgi:hypothetical protein
MIIIRIIGLSLFLMSVHSMTWAADPHSLEQLKKELVQLQKNYNAKIHTLEKKLQALEAVSHITQSTIDDTQEALDTLAIDVSQQNNQKAPNTFNPAIGVILNGHWLKHTPQNRKKFNIFSPVNIPNQSNKGLVLGESELSMSSNVDDLFYASVTLAFGDESEVEEAFIQTLHLGNGLNIKAGKFLSDIGYLSNKHQHTDNFSQRPIVYELFLDDQLSDQGLQITWLAPTDLYWETGAEIYRGDHFLESKASNSGNSIWTAFSHVGGDYGDSMSWKAGLSYLKSDIQRIEPNQPYLFDGEHALWIADFIYKWSPNGNASSQNFQVKGEYLTRSESLQSSSRLKNSDHLNQTHLFQLKQSGWYIDTIYQFSRQWRIGFRYSHVRPSHILFEKEKNTKWDYLNSFPKDIPKQISWMMDWSHSEFSRIRFQWDHYRIHKRQENTFTLQYIAAFGAHSAHTF